VGILSGILNDIASHLEIDKQMLIETLFRWKATPYLYATVTRNAGDSRDCGDFYILIPTIPTFLANRAPECIEKNLGLV
jgi:hypothetical protein